MLARWVEGGGSRRRVGPRRRSKSERIENKMGEAQSGMKEDKKRLCVGVSEGNGGYSCFAKVYSWFSRARDLLNNISLFFYY
jgi:hypothetical protein